MGKNGACESFLVFTCVLGWNFARRRAVSPVSESTMMALEAMSHAVLTVDDAIASDSAMQDLAFLAAFMRLKMPSYPEGSCAATMVSASTQVRAMI